MIKLSFCCFFRSSFPSRRILRIDTREFSAIPFACLTSSLRLSAVSGGIEMRITFPSFEGSKISSLAKISELSKDVVEIVLQQLKEKSMF